MHYITIHYITCMHYITIYYTQYITIQYITCMHYNAQNCESTDYTALRYTEYRNTLYCTYTFTRIEFYTM